MIKNTIIMSQDAHALSPSRAVSALAMQRHPSSQRLSALVLKSLNAIDTNVENLKSVPFLVKFEKWYAFSLKLGMIAQPLHSFIQLINRPASRQLCKLLAHHHRLLADQSWLGIVRLYL